jgi:ribose 5-phosphate isomerase B
MRIALGADEKTHLTDALVEALALRGHEVELLGPPAGEVGSWADVAREVGERVVTGRAEQGVVCCWTGTGVSIAANKVPGVRAALCFDVETARGARLWNDANVLCPSLRATSEIVGREILDAWLGTQPDGSETENIEKVRMMDVARGPL